MENTNVNQTLYAGFTVDYWIGYYDPSYEDCNYHHTLQTVKEVAKLWWKNEEVEGDGSLVHPFEEWLIAHGDTMKEAYLLAEELGQTVGHINKGIIDAFLMQNL